MIPITKETVSIYTRTETHSDTTGFVTPSWTFAFMLRVDVQDGTPIKSQRLGFGEIKDVNKYAFCFRNDKIIHGMQMRRQNGENYLILNPSHYDGHSEMFLAKDPTTI